MNIPGGPIKVNRLVKRLVRKWRSRAVSLVLDLRTSHSSHFLTRGEIGDDTSDDKSVSSNPAKGHVTEADSLTLAGIHAAEDKEALTISWKGIL